MERRKKAAAPPPAGSETPGGDEGGIRLHVFLARAGLASRREAERLIEAGEVTVNGKVVTELGTRVVEGRDSVRLGRRPVRGPARLRYYAYHKPVGCVSTMSDPEGRFCVGDVVEALHERGLFPVGRLDFHSSGLLLLTNDGELADRLMHPSHHVEKRYAVKVDPRPTGEAIEALRRGVRLHDGWTAPAWVRETRHAGGKSWFEVRIIEGRNQQVRRMFEAVGVRVEKLRRESVGTLRLGRLAGGDVRPLTAAEVYALREAVGLELSEGAPPRRRAPRASARTAPGRAGTRRPT